jgi:hypothetical protein
MQLLSIVLVAARCVLQAAALRFATPAKESRDKLVARLRDEQASQAARLEALKQVPGWSSGHCLAHAQLHVEIT